MTGGDGPASDDRTAHMGTADGGTVTGPASYLPWLKAEHGHANALVAHVRANG